MSDTLLDTPEYVVVPRQQVTLIDKIVDKLKDNESGLVETQNDWDAVVMLFELFKIEHPKHHAWFVETMKQHKANTVSNKGIVRDESGDLVHHVLEVPEIFHNYMHKMFPNQKWDKKFTRKLTSELPILKVSDSL